MPVFAVMTLASQLATVRAERWPMASSLGSAITAATDPKITRESPFTTRPICRVLWALPRSFTAPGQQ